MSLNRIKSVIRYLTYWADPVYKWRLHRGHCPVCGPQFFIAMGADPVMRRCLSCRATVGALSLIPVIKKHVGANTKDKAAYELSTYGVTLQWMQKNTDSVTTSEYLPEHPPGAMVDGVLNQDVHALTFPNNSFDLVTSNYVFEHVRDDIQGFRECRRVLKPGGAMIFSIPLFDLPATFQKAQIIAGKLVFAGEPEYHGSRTGGPFSAPVFWHHSTRDICNRLMSAGFSRAELADVFIAPLDKNPALVVYAVK